MLKDQGMCVLYVCVYLLSVFECAAQLLVKPVRGRVSGYFQGLYISQMGSHYWISLIATVHIFVQVLDFTKLIKPTPAKFFKYKSLVEEFPLIWYIYVSFFRDLKKEFLCALTESLVSTFDLLGFLVCSVSAAAGGL